MNTERPFSQALWEQTSATVQDYIRAPAARIMALESVVQHLEATVQPLTKQLRHDSRTSSRLPPSDPPQAIGKRPRSQSSGRRAGGHPGHEGQKRVLLPVEESELLQPVA